MSRSRASAVVWAVLVGAAGPAGAADPHQSFYELVTGNGYAVLGVDVSEGQAKLDAYLEHPYRFPREGEQTRDLCYDAYFGLRVGGQAVWLGEQPAQEAGYELGTGIVRVRQAALGLSAVTRVWSPYELDGPAGALLFEVRNDGASVVGPVSAFFLGNFRLGAGAPEPDAEGERIAWQGSGYVETGPSGLALGALPVPMPDRHACSPNNPYPVVAAGGDLVDTEDSGTVSDAVFGFQWDFGELAPGESRVVMVLLGHGEAGGDPVSRLSEHLAGRSPEELLEAERSQWEAWIRPAPEGLDAHQRALYLQSQVVLRMAQVREAGRGFGQILASLPPGNWNIAWVRDMCYAVVALAASGHVQEAWDALSFMLKADAGYYRDYVGLPYRISVTRYYGSGREESDWNENGPNIEFDGFGLFLWALGETVRRWPDAPWRDSWEVIRDEVADVLVGLMDPANGLIRADSSIWEVHWNGHQKHYAYTSLAAARGLCEAARLAQLAGEEAKAVQYLEAGRRIGRAVVEHLTDDRGVLAQSLEELLSGSGYHDAAVVEALGWGLVDPQGAIAQATLDMLLESLRPPSGRGFFRNDDGGWYDSQEWVFVDLRAAVAFRRAGRTAVSDELVSWIADQAAENFYLVAELHDAVTADYRGEVPMAGFGAGAFLLAVEEALGGEGAEPACGRFADGEPDGGLPDGGCDGSVSDAGQTAGGSDGCSCRSFGDAGVVWPLVAWALVFVRRRRGVRGGRA